MVIYLNVLRKHMARKAKIYLGREDGLNYVSLFIGKSNFLDCVSAGHRTSRDYYEQVLKLCSMIIKANKLKECETFNGRKFVGNPGRYHILPIGDIPEEEFDRFTKTLDDLLSK
jgi:hypothetical protein